MKQDAPVRLYVCTLAALLVLGAAATASAQYKPRPIDDPATGERFHIEAGAGWWNPSADMTVSSGGSGALAGIAGSSINAKRDLGFTDQRLPQFQITLRPAAAHKFRFQYVPIKYEADKTVQADIVFNGIRYRFGIPVTSTLDWKAYRFGYEFDFIRKNRGFGGFIMEMKYTDVAVQLESSPLVEFARARAPIPALGGIGRYYIVPNISITGELTAFKMPKIEDRYDGHYADLDIYGTVNFTNNIGVQGGYRSLDMGYLIKEDTGSFVLKGIYFGVIARY